MASNKLGSQVKPQLNLKDIKDSYIRKNFEEINLANISANHLQGFKFFEFTFAKGDGHFRPAHGLPAIPKDIIILKICGPGLVQFNRDLFSATQLDMTVSDACTIRFFVGTYWQDQEKSPVISDERSIFSGLLGSSTGAQSTPVSTSLPGLTAGEVTAIAEAAAAATATLVAAAAAAVPSGCVLPYGGTAAPTGYLLCDGSPISRVTYSVLFGLLVTTYGVGDGVSTFNLPDLRGRSVFGKDNMGGTTASRITAAGSGITGTTLGAVGGTETHTLTTAQLASHSHPVTTRNNLGGSPFMMTSGVLNQFTGNSTEVAGGGGAHQNTPPGIILNYIIKT